MWLPLGHVTAFGSWIPLGHVTMLCLYFFSRSTSCSWRWFRCWGQRRLYNSLRRLPRSRRMVGSPLLRGTGSEAGCNAVSTGKGRHCCMSELMLLFSSSQLHWCIVSGSSSLVGGWVVCVTIATSYCPCSRAQEQGYPWHAYDEAVTPHAKLYSAVRKAAQERTSLIFHI